jgi:hypothetical protein
MASKAKSVKKTELTVQEKSLQNGSSSNSSCTTYNWKEVEEILNASIPSHTACTIRQEYDDAFSVCNKYYLSLTDYIGILNTKRDEIVACLDNIQQKFKNNFSVDSNPKEKVVDDEEVIVLEAKKNSNKKKANTIDIDEIDETEQIQSLSTIADAKTTKKKTLSQTGSNETSTIATKKKVVEQEQVEEQVVAPLTTKTTKKKTDLGTASATNPVVQVTQEEVPVVKSTKKKTVQAVVEPVEQVVEPIVEPKVKKGKK